MQTATNVYVFNPTADYAIANGKPSWQANKTLQAMEADLATLPLFFSKKNDIVLVNHIPSQTYLAKLVQLGIEAPKFVLKQQIGKNNTKCSTAAINELRPWGWSPAAHKLLEPFKPFCSNNFKHSPVFNWNPEYKAFYSKKFARDILHKITKQYPSPHFIAKNQLPEVCTSKQQIELLLKKWGQIMIKAPWSSSGRGLQAITKTPIHPKVWEKILGIVKEQGYAVVEPYLNKIMDLGFLFHLKKGKIEFLGNSNFITDYKGQYNGNYLNGLPNSLSDELKKFVSLVPALVINTLIKTLEESTFAQNYEGHFGVDNLIFRDNAGNLKINPCLEINMRHTMGLLSLHIEKIIVPHKKGMFSTWFQPNTSFVSFKKEMEQKYPLVIKQSKIESGFFALSDATNTSKFGAYLLV